MAAKNNHSLLAHIQKRQDVFDLDLLTPYLQSSTIASTTASLIERSISATTNLPTATTTMSTTSVIDSLSVSESDLNGKTKTKALNIIGDKSHTGIIVLSKAKINDDSHSITMGEKMSTSGDCGFENDGVGFTLKK